MHHSFIASKGVKNVKLTDLMPHEQQAKAVNDDDYDDEMTKYLMEKSEAE